MTWYRTRSFVLAIVVSSIGCASMGPRAGAESQPVVLSEDGGWCWFQDPRAVVHAGWLWVGSIPNGVEDEERAGDVEVIAYHPDSGRVVISELADRLNADDHTAPALYVRPDGRILAVYAAHSEDRVIRYRVTENPGDPSAWTAERRFEPVFTTRDHVCYSNLHALRDEGARLYDFFRGNHFDPNVAVSDDHGETWEHVGRLLGGPGRPYVRYAGNGTDTLHFTCTDQHPRDADNSLYHGFLRGGIVHRSDGEAVGRVDHENPPSPHELTEVFAGTPDAVAWCADIALDRQERPVIVYTVQQDSAGLPRGRGGDDHRFRYARFDGAQWIDHPLAYAGKRLYAGEDDYTGLICLDPADTDIVYFSTDADPQSGVPILAPDGERRHQIFRGATRDGGAAWSFTAVTSDLNADHLRPIVARGADGEGCLLYLRGEYRSYTDYSQQVVARGL